MKADRKPDFAERAGYVFSQVSAAIIGGILLAAIVDTLLTFFSGGVPTAVGQAFIILFCIPAAWAVWTVLIRKSRR